MKSLLKLLTLASLFMATTHADVASAKSTVGIQDCYNISEEVNVFFTTCVRSNFKKISQRTNIEMEQCYNPGNQVSIFFPNCIRSNFSKTSDSLNSEYKLSPQLNPTENTPVETHHATHNLKGEILLNKNGDEVITTAPLAGLSTEDLHQVYLTFHDNIRHIFNTEKLSSGVYLYKASINNNYTTKKLIIAK